MDSKVILEWTLVNECDVPGDVDNLLVKGENAIAAYKTFRDMAIFTNKRLIVRDSQGITGKKIEVYSISHTQQIPKVEVPNTATSISKMLIVLGAIATVIGGSIVFITLRKEEN